MFNYRWNNRPYYWGQNYYQSQTNQQICRMPIDQTDSQFGNVYFSDNTRPREIVWGCGYKEYCCGYECCPQTTGYGSGGYYNNGIGRGFGLGYVVFFNIGLIVFCI